VFITFSEIEEQSTKSTDLKEIMKRTGTHRVGGVEDGFVELPV
jgi:hypothetical protein